MITLYWELTPSLGVPWMLDSSIMRWSIPGDLSLESYTVAVGL